MKHLTRSWRFLLVAGLLLAACGNADTSTASTPSASRFPTASPSPDQAWPTGTATAAAVTSLIPTPTPLPCDVLSIDFCVVPGDFILQRPITAPGNDVIDRNYPYGSTEGGTREAHHGVEFENASGIPVLAAAPGVVYYAGNDTDRKFSPWTGFYGNIVVLKHTFTDAPFSRLYTLYAHLSRVTVSSGQSVEAGATIGAVGMTGTAAGSHLHFEVRVNPDDYYSTLNPELWLTPRSGNGSLLILARDPNGVSIFPSFRIQYYPDRSKPAASSYLADGYASETVNPDDPWNEVAAIGDQPAGWYRISFVWNYASYERWVEIQPGRLTRVAFLVKR